ncbi:hypothetical protein BDW60DRAFT_227033 [Aspergillus nidulans var. acristatus]
MEQRVLHMESELKARYGAEDWSTTFRAGPESIAIIAECMVITSKPSVIGIELKGTGLAYSTLAANVSHCAEVGADTFRMTALNMKVIAQLTDQLSQPNGTVSGPVHSNYSQSIHSLFTMLRNSCYIGQKCREKQEVMSEIEKNKVDKELKEEQRRQEEARMNQARRRMDQIREKKEKYEYYANLLVSGSALANGGLRAVVASTSAVVCTGAGAVVAGAAAYIHYRTLEAELLSMEEVEERRKREIRELEVSKAALQKTLVQLSAESQSIGEIAEIVQESFRKVTQLQQLVREFMSFLLNINEIIKYTVKNSRLVYGALKVKEDLVEPDVKLVFLIHRAYWKYDRSIMRV